MKIIDFKKNNTIKNIFIYLFFFFTTVSFGQDFIEVLPVTNKIIALKFDEGHIDYAQIESNNVVYSSPLDTVAIYNLYNYQIRSTTDNDFTEALNPITVGRKSKSNDVNSMYPKSGDPQFILEHWVYLELPIPLKQGNTYTLSLNGLAENLSEYTFTFDVLKLRSEAVHTTQVGYKTNVSKYGYISQWMGDFSNGNILNGKGKFTNYEGERFDIVRVSDGVSVYNGTIELRKSLDTGGPMTDTPNDGAPLWFPCNCDYAQNYTFSDVLEADFSSVNTPGEYKLVVQNMGSSYPFSIGPDVFREPLNYVLRGLFFQRQGIVQQLPDGKIYPRDYHPDDISESRFRYDSNWRWIDDPNHEHDTQEADVTGYLPVWGWYHDAGDWDTYPMHGHIPLALNLLYDLQPNNFMDGDVANKYKLSENDANWIDEGTNGIPDVLDEAAWLIKYYKRAKDLGLSRGLTTGGVPGGYGGIDAGALDGYPSWEDPRELHFSAEDPFQTYMYAATAAYYAANLEKVGDFSAEAQNWINEAKDAWNWANNNTAPGDESLNNSAVKKIRILAAVALFKATQNTFYQNEFKNGLSNLTQFINGEESWEAPEYWEYAASIYAILPYNFPGLDVSFQTTLKNKLISVAESEYVNTHDRRGYRVGFDWRKAHILGMASTPMLTTLIATAKFTGDQKYLNVIHNSANFFLGGNPDHLTWISGLGENPIKYPFHPNSWYLLDLDSKVYSNEILPGYVPYGSYMQPDFMGWGYSWTGDEDFSKTSMYPTYEYQTWPIMEQRVENRTSIAGSEFTIWQNMGQAALAYGFLTSSPSGNFTFNDRPTVVLNVDDEIEKQGQELKATTSADTKKVAYYYNEHFIGASTDANNSFSYLWKPSLVSGTENIKITAVAYDDKGYISQPSSSGEKIVSIVSGNFIEVDSIAISPKSGSLENIGDQLQLSIEVFPSNATNKKITWASSNNTVVTVNSEGLITGNENGFAFITATSLDGSKSHKIKITVGDYTPVEAINFPSPSLSIPIKSIRELQVEFTPSNASLENLVWVSTDPDIASIDESGNVSAKSLGTTTITAKSTELNLEASLTLTVTALSCSNRLVNGGFESGLNNWNTNIGSPTTTSDSIEGDLAAQMLGESGVEQTFDLDLEEGKNIVLRFSAKLDANNGFAGAGVDFKDENGNTIVAKYLEIESLDWQEYYVQGKAPAGTKKINVWFYTQSDLLTIDNFCMDIEGETGNSNLPISVNITSPNDNQEFNLGDPIEIKAEAFGGSSTDHVTFWRVTDGKWVWLTTDYTYPFVYSLTNATLGNHIIKARATDSDGNASIDDEITISVINSDSTTPITVSVNSPLEGDTFQTDDTVNISATTSGGNGTDRITFWRITNGEWIWLTTDYSSPFTYSLTNIPQGNHIIKARATDKNGNESQDDEVSITVMENLDLSKGQFKRNFKNLESLLLYPNPLKKGNLTIELPKSLEGDIEISLFDMFGRLVYKRNTTKTKNIIHKKNLASGTYILKIKTIDLEEDRTLIVQ
ncbi:Ig-like domain-containing protein [Galbibacter sp. BG1]|uniref:Ig-like domain-containing protein n=1 Tax=Galbibacter sp. BG1 TaxID=1170699 RepID=UPI0015BDEF9E|nr:Ig-like domain-containing protein [Galbibacter sp. BG1]QLE01826.1 Ig-like domain-containing protein [Galbibacter sp. BG1]